MEGGAASSGWHWVEATATRISPVVIDLDGDGVELTAATASPGFDFFGTGYAMTTGWFSGGDALLVFDGNQNGQVDSGAEISFLHHAPGSTTDLQALAAFDTNSNGKLDSGDGQFGLFRLWRDFNFNGISDPGELQTLASGGVSAIGLQASGGGYQVAGNDIHGTSTVWRSDGSTATAYDVGFEAYSRGSKQISQSTAWTVMEIETGERVALSRPGAAPVAVTNAGSAAINGVSVSGFQLGDSNDSLSTGFSGNKALYVDGGAGADTINLSKSSYGSVIKGGSGDDMIYGTTGNDYIAPGTSTGSEQVIDQGGDDYYVIDDGSFVTILDSSGTDVAVLSTHTSAQL
jgi:hypothetical protein